ncbi:MAG: hypothetical protein MI673_09495, partial [Thiotrichales bacterium]|nr:hypothetical protein [Thiotrichales bacterium]
HKNSSLESITIHDRAGMLVAPEKLSGNYPEDEFQIFSLGGQKWTFTNTGGLYGSITGLGTSAAGDLIALERIFQNVFTGVSFALHHIRLNDNEVRHSVLLEIGPADGYFSENFEGITHYGDNHYFMISDDNENAMLRTLLIFFKLPDTL